MFKNIHPFRRHMMRDPNDSGSGRPHWRGGGRGRGLFGRGDFPGGGRKLGSEDLQRLLLSLLGRQPAHGYELIRQIEELSGGFYAPSPGMVYPALIYLNDIGHASVTIDGNRKLYSITEEGRAELAAHQTHVDAIVAILRRIATRMSDVRDAFAGVHGTDGQAADDLHQARRALKEALMAQHGCSPDETRRIAEILRKATAAILGTEA